LLNIENVLKKKLINGEKNSSIILISN